MKKHLLKSLLSVTLLAISVSTVAEDIDLFISTPPSSTVDAPNVLLIIDNGANFSANVSDQVCRISAAGEVSTTTSALSASDNTALNGTAGAVEQCALYSVIKGMDVSSGVKVNIGVMVFNANGLKDFNAATNTFSSNCASGNGGCLIVPIVPLNATTKANLLDWIKRWQVSGNSSYNIKGNGHANGATMQEAWAYYAGTTGISGRNYSSIKPNDACKKNNIIFIGNAYRNNASPGDQTTGSAGPKSALEGTNGTTGMNANPAASALDKALVADVITTSCGTNTLESSETKGVYALNWARYLRSQSTTTYSIGILGPTCNGEYAAHLTKMGSTDIGGGKYFPTNNFAELVVAMNTILGEIQAVNTVFAAVSLPVSVNTQGTYLNQVYIGMFRPDADALPRWTGNLKQYKLGRVNNEVKLQDADSASAINSGTGFITECARSFWTPTTIDNYWEGSPKAKGGCTAIANSGFSNYPDGNIVEKGGQAYQLRNTGTTARKVKTCSFNFGNCSTTATLTSFDTNNNAIQQWMLDPASGATNRNALINWARGLNSLNELSKGTTAMRPSVHGDVVHSRPVAVNYGSDASPQVVVYYGGNDGMLRAINGNRGNVTDATVGQIASGGSTFAPGGELWSFMPPEFYGNIKRIYDNSTTITYKGGTVSGALPKPYGMDGPITAFQGVISNENKVLIFSSMRRGGRALYAFDVTTPGAPTMKWKRGCPNNFPNSGTVDDTDCSNGFSGIGQTWSSAKTLYASGHGSGASPMVILGGGYDTCEDTDNGTVNHNCTTATTKGNKIYVLDANDGTRLVTLDTDRSVTGDVTIVKDSATGMAKYAYATDLGGNVYRISGANPNTPFGSTAPAGWTITKIASLGCDTVAPCSANRKFLYGPDVVYDNGLYVLLIGSGDREKPLGSYTATYGVTNHFFMVKDDPASTSWLSSQSAVCGTAVICKSSLLGITDNNNPTQADVDAKKGWYLALARHEQVVTTSVTVFGTVSFSTHQPAVATVGACGSNLGTALVYNIAYSNAASKNGTGERYQDLGGDGLPPSPVAGQVTLDDGQTVPFCIGCSPSSPLEGTLKTKPPTSSASQYKSRIYWYIQR
jgi:type IV pilus assembly protein PilY1